MKILGIAGSLRRQSYNRAALRAAQQLLPEGDIIETFDLEGIPLFSQDIENSPPPRVVEFKQRIREAGALLIATPEYNHSIPGVLKNAIDWASRPYGDNAWGGKPAAIMGASPGALGTARAQTHLREIFVSLNVLVVNQPEVIISNASARFNQAGDLADEATRNFIRTLLANLSDWSRRLQPTA